MILVWQPERPHPKYNTIFGLNKDSFFEICNLPPHPPEKEFSFAVAVG
jgi:hypothetical protein